MPRRNILRPPRSNGVVDHQRARRRQRVQADIERATVALTRWQSKLRRSFTMVEKLQRQLGRLNKALHLLDG